MNFLCKIGLHKFREFLHPSRLRQQYGETVLQCERCGIYFYDDLVKKKAPSYTWGEWKKLKEKQ